MCSSTKKGNHYWQDWFWDFCSSYQLSVLFFSRRLDLVLWWFESEAANSYHMEAKEGCQNPARYRKTPNIPTGHPEGRGARSPLGCDRCHCNTFLRSVSYKEDGHFLAQIFWGFGLTPCCRPSSNRASKPCPNLNISEHAFQENILYWFLVLYDANNLKTILAKDSANRQEKHKSHFVYISIYSFPSKPLS